ncbi:MAG: hypothetical protein QG622_2462 [Actinomycetota bacterium]|nr:hypothetical protein [Actinomycetota bacterium]
MQVNMPSRPGRPRRPALLAPVEVDAHVGGVDPAELVQAAHATAEALVRHGRGGDDAVTARLVALTDEHGLDEVALLWAERPADSLPGALWRLYALRAGIRGRSELIARAFDVGRRRAPVHEVVAGVGDPPGPAEVRALADSVLAGAFTGDLGVALDRAGAFCRIVSTGWALLADEITVPAQIDACPDDHPDDHPGGCSGDDVPAVLTRRASDLLRTGIQLESAARRWRSGALH